MNNEACYQKRVYWLGFIGFWMAAGAVLSSHYGFYCNMSDSFSQDYFIVKKQFLPHELHKGTIVITRIDFDNPYIEKGKRLIKQIAGEGGDRLESREKEFYCNDKRIAVALSHDSKGRKMEPFEYNGIIPQGYVFLTADHPKSFDSRYFGLSLKAKVEEIGLWRF